ncbi:glutamine synthetase family protein [Sneathiella sp. HT1-7]|jgi:glutamine synthetase|uniref:glutamine synthetase family protein n=1 Tax=Sneathiella sp. HT1-7 TaxID=2887192 RepID=UPI001D13F023|nr:glutamine synthetase [Sneathiella sp. HT1-7]MCC3305737.1 glutamine synthetase [Sneathiella sp. HT1-7]
MEARFVKTVTDARSIIEDRDLDFVKVGVFDIDGVLRGKYLSKDKFFSILETGFGFCDVVLGWDVNDQLYDTESYTGWSNGYADAKVVPIIDSCRELPLEDNMLFFQLEFGDRAGHVCPRQTLKRVLKRAEDMGIKATAACEFEFFLFKETPESVREKNYYNLDTFTPGNFGYSFLRASVEHNFYEQLLALCEEMDMPIEGLHTETGPGVLEAALVYDEAMKAADKGALFKTFTKILAQKNDLMATFMAKWSPDYPGQSGHIHLSLQGKDGEGLFFDEGKENNFSDAMRYFIGGQQKLMPEFLAMIAPTINSYTRMIPGFWAPTEASWGIENRTTALRAIPGSDKSQRVEYRIAAADINPHIAIAAALGSGLWGIENKIEPTTAVVGNAYDQEFPEELTLPKTLWEATQLLKKSTAARDLFGDAFVDHYAVTREWEEREFRKAITDWEMQRYFEII